MNKNKMLMAATALALLCSGAAAAQSWTLYVPPEGDFRVLLPGMPARVDHRSGSVEYRVDAPQQRYSVFRHDPRRLAGKTAKADITERLNDGDQYARNTGDDDGDLAANEFTFRVGTMLTMHRVITDSGRYYELVVQAPSEDGLSRPLARDFFNSFQTGAGVGSIFPALTGLPGPDTCQARSNAFSRRFCEYLTCLAPSNQGHAVCTGLPKLFRN
jgi:hypothetical protein